MTSWNADESLLLNVSKGDETAFKKLFENWYPFLASHIFRITNSKEVTEEIVHDVFLKIWLTRETLAEINNFKAYLVVVSRNHALSELRKLTSDSKKRQGWLKEMKQQDDEDPSVHYYSLIDEAIDQLSSRQREIYLMHRHQRLTYYEIAGRLGISRETVKSHLQVATGAITKYVTDKMKITLLLLGLINFIGSSSPFLGGLFVLVNGCVAVI